LQLAVTPVLSLMGLGEPAHGYAEDYMRVVAFAAVPCCVCFVARNVAEGHGLPRVALVAGLVAFVVNAVLDYALMYGRLGFPELGPKGAAWATVAGSTAMV